MKPYPTRTTPRFLCFVFFALLVVISCTKDGDLLQDAVLDNSSATIDDQKPSSGAEEEQEEEADEEPGEEEMVEAEATEKAFETRTTIFPPIHDAHLQGDQGYDQNIVRLEEGRRTSYLMFDLSQIDSIGGTLNATNLEFTIDSDNGSGTIAVFKGASNDWSEEELSAKNAPEADIQLGELVTEYKIGETHEVKLDSAAVRPELFSLVMVHVEGNDLAFASKEHPSGDGPKLVATYSAPQDADTILIEEEETVTNTEGLPDGEETVTEESPDGDEATDEDEPTTEEESAEDESTDGEEATDEEESTNEEESTKEEESTEGEEATDEEETTEEEESPGEEKTNDEPEDTDSEADAQENQGPMAVADASPSTGSAPLKVSFKGSNSDDDKGIEKFAWNFDNGETSGNANNEHTFTEVGTYEVSLTVTDAEGETDTDVVTITVRDEENQAPVAKVSATPTSGSAPLDVQFTGKNSTDDNSVTSYKWDFKDGSTSGNANPSHTFDTPGEYEVTLNVKDENGLEDTETITITVNEQENEAPNAIASASPSSGQVPLNVQFEGGDSEDDGEIKTYRWDFKDGSTSGNKNPTHTFDEAGTYEVELTVTDDEGLKDSKVVTITVSAPQNEPPSAVASANPTSGKAPLEVRFKGSDSNDDDSIASAVWDFKDGTTTGNIDPTHTFEDPGTYEVTLTVKDNDGQTDTKSITITVEENSTGGNTGGNTGNYPSNAVFASSFGYNSSDATSAFEAAIKSGSSYVVIDKQSSDWIIRPTRFFDLRDMTIVFEPGVTLRAKSGAFSEGERLFQLTRANNVTIEGSGATFKMNKNEYNSGEQRHAFGMTRSRNVTVRGLTLRDSGGDGIYIAGDGNSDYSQNITLENIRCLNNRRDGITIVSAQDVWIRNSEFSQSSGKKPEAGATLEADKPTERLVNINFINCKFSGNDSAGLHFSTARMNSSSIPVSIKVIDCEFSNNMVSPSSGVPSSEIYIGGGKGTNVAKGELRFERIKFNGSRGRVIFTRKSANGFKAIFRDCEARNVVTSVSSSPIELQAHEDRNTLGGMTFDDFYLEYNRNVPFMHINAPSDGGSFKVKDISGSFTIREPNDNPLKYSGGYKPSSNQNVSIDYNHN